MEETKETVKNEVASIDQKGFSLMIKEEAEIRIRENNLKIKELTGQLLSGKCPGRSHQKDLTDRNLSNFA
jgi:hypothetical protein